MITQEVLTQLKHLTANMQTTITLVVQTGEHEKREELITFLTDFSSCSNKIQIEERSSEQLRSPVSFLIEADGIDTGIRFSGIPGGHEFNSMVLAVLQASGTAIKLDDSIKSIVSNISKPLQFEVFISLSCHNCPEVVQALNAFAIINKHISCEMIDGGVYPELVTERNIQGVPTVFLNGEIFSNGKIDTAGILNKLNEKQVELFSANTTESLPLQDVTVIGGGPAGVGAAIYSARKGLKVTLIADRIGGQVKDTMGIENFISVPETTGTKLSAELHAHAREYDITIKEHLSVSKVEKGDTKKIHLNSGEIISSKTIIIATGAKWRELGIPGEKENVGNGVAYCPHCDGPFFKGKDVAVIGGGNSGIEAALDLSGIVKSVTVFEFLPQLKADEVTVKKAREKSNINILTNVTTQEIVSSNGKVSAITYMDRETADKHSLDLSGVFVQIGLSPNSSFLTDVVDMTTYGEIIINERCETSEAGIFACGDVTTVPYKQIIIAMGEGAKASLACYDYLLKQ